MHTGCGDSIPGRSSVTRAEARANASAAGADPGIHAIDIDATLVSSVGGGAGCQRMPIASALA
jgi:hypothetical protein